MTRSASNSERQEGHLQKRGKNGMWHFVYRINDPATGSRKQKSQKVGLTLREANKAKRRILHELEEGTYVEPTKITVAEVLDRWLKDVCHSVRPKTLERYREIVDKHLKPALGQHQVRALQPDQISAAWADALATGRRNGKGGLGKRTVRHHHRVLSQALRQALSWRIISWNPADVVKPPAPDRREMMTLSEARSRDLLAAIEGTRLHLPVLLALATGMRRGEILGLPWGSVDLERHQLFVTQTLEQTAEGLKLQQPKTDRSRRRIPLPPFAIDALRRHKIDQATRALARGWRPDERTPVICRDDGQPIKPGSLTKEFSRTLPRLGFPPLRFHDLRHSHASLLLLRNMHPKVVSERLGHASVGITLDTYSHVAQSLHEAVADEIETLFTVPKRTPVEQA